MSVGSSLQKVVDAIASFERNGTDVTSIETYEPDLSSSADLTVQFSATEQLFDAADDVLFSVDDASLESDGTLRLDMTATAKIDGDDPSHLEQSELQDDSIQTVESTVTRDDGTDADRQPSNDSEPPRDEDPEALRTVYEECDSFRKMRDALGSDVTPETIRRRMVSYGIHTVPSDDEDESTEPKGTPSNDSNADESDGTSPSLSDVLSEDTTPIKQDAKEPVLPDGGNAIDLSINELVDVVQSSNTIYQAHQRLELDQDQTRRLLKKLDLINLVTGRIATLEDRSVTREEIEGRIRTAAQPTSS